jgi:hypothetical protein
MSVIRSMSHSARSRGVIVPPLAAWPVRETVHFLTA